MENSNSGRPVPATDEIITNLPREVLKERCTGATMSSGGTFGLHFFSQRHDCKWIVLSARTSSNLGLRIQMSKSWSLYLVHIRFTRAASYPG